jgi:hypothetical protein
LIIIGIPIDIKEGTKSRSSIVTEHWHLSDITEALFFYDFWKKTLDRQMTTNLIAIE